MTADVAIILLNYGHVDKTLACLDSLSLMTGPTYQIFVVDNASPDESLLHLRERLAVRKAHTHPIDPTEPSKPDAPLYEDDEPEGTPGPHIKKRVVEDSPPEFTLIESARNLGYSGGCNLAIRAVRALLDPPSYIWLLNNDTMVDTQSLSALVAEAQRTGGLVGSLLLYPDNRYQQVGTRFNRWTGRAQGYREGDVHDGMPVEMLSGASLLIPMRAIARVGLLDERFFLYFEDGEYCLRCARAGFQLTVATDSRIYHVEGASTGKRSPATQYYYQRNRLRLLSQVVSPLQRVTIALYSLFRWGRAHVKCLPIGNPEKLDTNRLACRIYDLAIRDFMRGIDGQCLHDFKR